MTMTRKEFLGTVLRGTAAGALIAATTAACGGGGDDGGGADAPGGANCLQDGTVVTIQSNHGHTLTVSAADVQAGTDRSYDITGSAAHSHSVMVTAANFQRLASNMPVTLTSTTGGGHTHTISVVCA